MEDILLEEYPLKSSYKLEKEEEGEESGRLSFCNLSATDQNPGSFQQSPRALPAQTDQLFEFFTSRTRPTYSSPDIIKFIHEEEKEFNEYQKRDYFATIKSKSHSFRNPFISDHAAAAVNRGLSSSTHFSSELTRSKSSTVDVNITSLTSMSAKSRRRMFMFGPVKFKPEMELSAIKQRQQTRRQNQNAPAASFGGGKEELGLVRSGLRGTSYDLTSVLVKSLACIPVGAGRR